MFAIALTHCRLLRFSILEILKCHVEPRTYRVYFLLCLQVKDKDAIVSFIEFVLNYFSTGVPTGFSRVP